MRRTLVVIAVIASLAIAALGESSAHADVANTGICAITSYTVTGAFNVVGGAASFHVHAVGSCVGTTGGLAVGATGVTVDVDYDSIGPWSCDAGAAHGTGLITANGGANRVVDSDLVNVGGEYVIEVLDSPDRTAAAGQFTTLPIACDAGQTQTTIGGTGTLTFTA